MKILANYKNFWNSFKKKYPNIYILLISTAIVTFFKGMTGLLTNMTYNLNSVEINLLLIFIAIAILYSNDNSLSELYNLSPGNQSAIGVSVNST